MKNHRLSLAAHEVAAAHASPAAVAEPGDQRHPGWCAGVREGQAGRPLLLLLVLFENVHAFNERARTRSAFHVTLSANWLLMAAVGGSQGVHIALLFILGWRDMPVALTTWAVLLAVTLSMLLVVEPSPRGEDERAARRRAG